MGKRSSLAAPIAIIIEIVIIAVILLTSFYVVNTILSSLSDQQALNGFADFIEPISEVCKSGMEAETGGISITVPGKTYVLAQIDVPEKKFLNSKGNKVEVKARMEKCVGGTCLCLLKINENPVKHDPWKPTNVEVKDMPLFDIIYSSIPKYHNFCQEDGSCAPPWFYSAVPVSLAQIVEGFLVEIVAATLEVKLCAGPIITGSNDMAEMICKRAIPGCSGREIPVKYIIAFPLIMSILDLVSADETVSSVANLLAFVVPAVIPIAYGMTYSCIVGESIVKGTRAAAYGVCWSITFNAMFYSLYDVCAENVRADLFMPTVFYFPYPQYIIACSDNKDSLEWNKDTTDCPDLSDPGDRAAAAVTGACGGTTLIDDLINGALGTTSRSVASVSVAAQLSTASADLAELTAAFPNAVDDISTPVGREAAILRNSQTSLKSQLAKAGVNILIMIMARTLFGWLAKYQDVDSHDCGWFFGAPCKDFGCRINPIFPISAATMVPPGAKSFFLENIMFRIMTNCPWYGIADIPGIGFIFDAIATVIFGLESQTGAQWGATPAVIIPNPGDGAIVTDNCLDRSESLGYMLSYKRWADPFCFGSTFLTGSAMPRNFRVETYDKEIFDMNEIDVLKCVKMEEIGCAKKVGGDTVDRRLKIWRWSESFLEVSYVNMGELLATVTGAAYKLASGVGTDATLMIKLRTFLKAMRCLQEPGTDMFSCMQLKYIKDGKADTFNQMVFNDILPDMDELMWGRSIFGPAGVSDAITEIEWGRSETLSPDDIFNVNDVDLPALRYFQAWIGTYDPWGFIGDSGNIYHMVVKDGPHRIPDSNWDFGDGSCTEVDGKYDCSWGEDGDLIVIIQGASS